MGNWLVFRELRTSAETRREKKKNKKQENYKKKTYLQTNCAPWYGRLIGVVRVESFSQNQKKKSQKKSRKSKNILFKQIVLDDMGDWLVLGELAE